MVRLQDGLHDTSFGGLPTPNFISSVGTIGLDGNGTGLPGSAPVDVPDPGSGASRSGVESSASASGGARAASTSAVAVRPASTRSAAQSDAVIGGTPAAQDNPNNTGNIPLPIPVAPAPAAADPGADSVFLLTSQNRRAHTMTGGWNPALRSILVMNDGSKWFAAERGNSVRVDSTMLYYRLGPTGWKAVGSVMLPRGVQQNMATITDGRFIFAYGCARNKVIETWFDTTKPGWNLNTSNALWAGGSVINPGPESNYIGAAWQDKTRIVWWTTVGPGGSGGTWTYTYNHGRGWNGPVVSGLGGYNSLGYVRAQFVGPSRLRMIGQDYLGGFPSGHRLVATTTFRLGNACQWTPRLLGKASTPLDQWQPDSTDGTQVLYRTYNHKTGYSFVSGKTATTTIFSAVQARFIVTDRYFGLVLGYKSYVEARFVPRAAATGFVDWNAVPPTTLPLPVALKSRGLSAIWSVDASKQPNASNQFEFAVCGGHPTCDRLIFYYKLPLP